ncbi:MAG TPA: MFS transporter [Solirubrobacteraceae bacterium]|nr:MFS transporter [Solirubrobacteraceae bacterium]
MRWTFAITSLSLFMFALDRLVVTTALPAIESDIGGGVAALAWTVNAFTLTFSVLLLTGGALGDRFGRRRVFVAGIALFTLGSAAAALAPTAGALIAARALQGVGGAVIMPVSLAILMAATPAARRGTVLGAWAAVAAAAATAGPVAGGALAATLSWHWIFWLNVPIGLALIPLALRRLDESHGPEARLDVRGVTISAAALLALVWGVIAGEGVAIAAGALGLVTFVAHERRAAAPMLPMQLFADREFATASTVSVLAYGGLFGALFVLGQSFGTDPLEAALHLLPMTAVMAIGAPAAGALTDRIGARPLMLTALLTCAVALTLLAAGDKPSAAEMLLLGAGASCLFAPIQATLIAAPGAAVALRELGGVLGVAVLAAGTGLGIAAAAVATAALVVLLEQLYAVAPGIRRVEAANAR